MIFCGKLGIKLSGISQLDLDRSYLRDLSPSAWENFTNLMREKQIVSLNVDAAHSIQRHNGGDQADWERFCHFIVHSKIKALAFNVCPSDYLRNDQSDQIRSAFVESDLKILSFEHMSYSFRNMPENTFRNFFESVQQSKITHLPHLFMSGNFSGVKGEIVTSALNHVRQRTKEQCTLVDLCVDRLFNKYNARLTEEGIRYTHEGTTWEYPYLPIMLRETIWSSYTPKDRKFNGVSLLSPWRKKAHPIDSVHDSVRVF